MDNQVNIQDLPPENEEGIEQVPKYTKLFKKAIDQFQMRAFFLFLERIYLIITMSILLSTLEAQQCEWDSLHYWVLFSDIQAIFSFFLYLQIFMYANNQRIVEKLAEQYVQIVYVPIDQATNDPLAPAAFDPTLLLTDQEITKKSDVMAMQIRSEIVNESFICKFNNYFSTFTNQLIFVWTMVYFIAYQYDMDSEKYQCQKWSIIQTNIYGLLLFIQYSHYYLIAAIIIVLMPFILIFLLLKCFKDRKQKQQTQNALRELQKSIIQYRPNKVEGEQECSICMEAYKSGDEVLILPCTPLHHFHNVCISAWLNVQSTCPNCRQPIFPQGQQEPLLHQ